MAVVLHDLQRQQDREAVVTTVLTRWLSGKGWTPSPLCSAHIGSNSIYVDQPTMVRISEREQLDVCPQLSLYFQYPGMN